MVILYFSPRHLSPLALVHSLVLWPLNYRFLRGGEKKQNRKTNPLQPSTLPPAGLRAGQRVCIWAAGLASAAGRQRLLVLSRQLFSWGDHKTDPTPPKSATRERFARMRAAISGHALLAGL